MRKVCLQTFRNNRICKISLPTFKEIYNVTVNNSSTVRIKKAKFSGLCLYMNTNI